MKKIFLWFLLIFTMANCVYLPERTKSFYTQLFEKEFYEIPKTQNWDFYKTYCEFYDIETKSNNIYIIKDTTQPEYLYGNKDWKEYLPDKDNSNVGSNDFTLIADGEFFCYAVWYDSGNICYDPENPRTVAEAKKNFSCGIIDENGTSYHLFGPKSSPKCENLKNPNHRIKDHGFNPGYAKSINLGKNVSFKFYLDYYNNITEHRHLETEQARLLHLSIKEDRQIMIIAFEDTPLNKSGVDKDFNDIVLYLEGNPNLPITLAKRFMCEDCGNNGDFDFNDLVFDVLKTDNDSLSVIIQAAGGTLPIHLKVAGKYIGEVHDLLGVDRCCITNTGYYSVPPYTINISVSNINMKNFNDVVLTVGDGINAVSYGFPDNGKAPYIISVPINTPWMKEQISIKDGYPKFFTQDWYLEYNKKNIIYK